jgi:hypothetical protein
MGCFLPILNQTNAYKTNAPKFQKDFVTPLTREGENWQLNPGNFKVSSENTLRENIVALFYPSRSD